MAEDTYQYIETIRNEQFLVTRQGNETLDCEPLTSQPPYIIHVEPTAPQKTNEEEEAPAQCWMAEAGHHTEEMEEQEQEACIILLELYPWKV